MNKILEKALEDYKKASKAARIKILAKYDCGDEKEFFELCGVKIKELKTVHNVHILDTSGSMNGGKIKAALEGINDEVEEMKTITDVKFTQTVVKFSSGSDYHEVYWKEPLINVKPINCCAVGGTALFDAIGRTLSKLKAENNGTDNKVLVKIFTDGEENSSVNWRKKQVQDLIDRCQKEGFTVTFVGTKKDVEYMVDNLSVDISNTYVHYDTAESINFMSQERSGATKTYARKVAEGKDVERGFFTKEEGTL